MDHGDAPKDHFENPVRSSLPHSHVLNHLSGGCGTGGTAARQWKINP